MFLCAISQHQMQLANLQAARNGDKLAIRHSLSCSTAVAAPLATINPHRFTATPPSPTRMAPFTSEDAAPTVRSMLTNRREFFSSYINMNIHLGHGAFGSVALWKCRQTHEHRAIKTQRLLDVRDVADWQREERALQTAAASSDPDARHIIKIYASCLTDKIAGHTASHKSAGSAPPGQHMPQVQCGYLVMEYAGMTLSALLKLHPEHPVPEVLQLSGHLFRGLTFMHSKGIIHRDIKPNNTMLVETHPGGWVLKLGDFGLSRDEAQVMTAAVVTLPYRAPEILLGAVTDKAGLPNCLQACVCFVMLVVFAATAVQTIASLHTALSKAPATDQPH